MKTEYRSQCYYFYTTKIGDLTVVCDGDEAVLKIAFGRMKVSAAAEKSTGLTDRTAAQIREYLAGERREFDLPLRPEGTEFQRRVWSALCTIPYGDTRSYKEIAAQTGNAKACRAVGMANNRNPIAIVIPCHRVVGADGALTGYGGGLEIKKALLELESGGLSQRD